MAYFKSLLILHREALEALPLPELKRSLYEKFTTLPQAEHMFILAHATGTVVTLWSEAFINASRVNAIAIVKETLGDAVEAALDDKERSALALHFVAFRTHEWLRCCFTEYRNITNGRWALTTDEETYFKSLPNYLG